MIYGLGRELTDITAIGASDFVPASNVADNNFHSCGIETYNTWEFSAAAKCFRQTGGNSNGMEWTRYYQAIKVNDKNIKPAHIV
jgi:hypothetical protein